MKTKSNRLQRINELVQKALAQMLIEEMSDKRFRLVTITDVSVARDLSFAKVYVTVLLDDQDEIKSIIKALNNATKVMRHQLASEVKLRVVPQLKFIYDESTAHGFHIAGLIDAAMKKSNSEE